MLVFDAVCTETSERRRKYVGRSCGGSMSIRIVSVLLLDCLGDFIRGDDVISRPLWSAVR